MGLLLHRVISGFDERRQEIRAEDQKREQLARKQYLDHLNRRLEEAIVDGDDDVVEWVTGERERVHSFDPNKPYKPRPVPLPGRLSGKPASGAPKGQTVGGNADAQVGAAPPNIMDALDAFDLIAPQSMIGTSGVPTMPTTSGPQSFGATPTPLPAAATTPPGRSAPASSPMLPGVVPGVSAARPGAGTSAASPIGIGGASASVDEPTAVRRARIAGQAKAALEEPTLRLRREINAPPTVRDILAAARAGYAIDLTPEGTYVRRPLTADEYSLLDKSKMSATDARREHMSAQQRLWQAEIEYKRAQVAKIPAQLALAEGRLRIARQQAATAKQNADSVAKRLEMDAALYGFAPMSTPPTPNGGGGGGGATPPSAGGGGGPDEMLSDPNVRTTVTDRQYVDLSGLSSKIKAAMKIRYEAMGVPALDGPEAEVVRQIDTTRLNQSTIWGTILDKLPRDAAGRVVGGAKNRLEALLQTDDELGAYNSFRAAAIQSLYALAGGRGFRLNQREIQLALENDIPRITDTVEVAERKLRSLSALLDNKEVSLLVPRRAGMQGSRGRLEITPPSAASPSKQPKPTHRYNPSTGRIEAVQ